MVFDLAGIERWLGLIKDITGVDCHPTAPLRWKSIAKWPSTSSTGRFYAESVDIHTSKEAANAVCLLLLQRGLGGLAEVFPISTRVVLA